MDGSKAVSSQSATRVNPVQAPAKVIDVFDRVEGRELTFVFLWDKAGGGSVEAGRAVCRIDVNALLAEEVRTAFRHHAEEFGLEDWSSWCPEGTYPYLEFGFLPKNEVGAQDANPRGSRPLFLVAADGHVVTIASRMYPLNLTFAGLERTIAAGLGDYDLETVVVSAPGGRGSTGQEFEDFVIWLLNHGVDLGVGSALTWLFARVRGGRADRKARRVARAWDEAGFAGPRMLREFLSQKQKWQIWEVCKRLRVNEHVAHKLLLSTGYELQSGGWELGLTWQARRRRKKWMKHEY